MSEQSGGPGWWQASDGKWYPPEQASAVPPTPDPTQPIPPVYGGPPTAPTGAPAYGAPALGVPAAAAAGGGGAGKVIAIVVVLALLAGGGAFLLTRGGGSSGGSVASFCDTAKKFQNDSDLNNAFDDPSKIDKALTAFDQLAKSAPSEIKADVNTINDAVKKIGQAIKAAGSDQSKQFTAIFAAAASLDQKKLEAAGQHIETFGKQKCGADFSFSEGGSSSSSFDTSSFESSLSDSFSSFSSSFDTSSFDSDSLSSQFSSLCSDFGSDFGSDFCSSS